MPSGKQVVEVYEELANLQDQLHAAQTRDRYLILAADAALSNGDKATAERLRARLLEYNPHHMTKPYGSLAEAMRSPDVFSYVADLRHTYPPEDAERELKLLRGGEAPDPHGTLAFGAAVAEPEPYEEPAPAPEIYPFNQDVEAKSLPKDASAVPAAEETPAAPRKGKRKRAPATLHDMPDVYPYPEESGVSRSRASAEPAEMSPLNLWVSNILFSLLLAAGIGLLGYTLARPYLQL